MHTVLQVEFAAPFDHVREEVAVKGGVLGQERFKVEGLLGGDEGVETHLLRRDSSPVGVGHAVLGVGAAVAYFFEDHGGAFCRFSDARRHGPRGALRK